MHLSSEKAIKAFEKRYNKIRNVRLQHVELSPMPMLRILFQL
jgi:hypothetical protein